MTPTTAPYGSWRSPFRATEVSAGTLSFSLIQATQDGVYWLEQRPSEAGRTVVVRRTAAGQVQDVTPAGFNVRTRIHEYGGGAYTARREVVVFANFEDQRLYRQEGLAAPRPITAEPALTAGLRYADMRFSPDGAWIVCVQEVHRETGQPANRVVLLPGDCSAAPRPIAEGRDFYSSPRFSPDGKRLAWLEWDHPNMPWDGTELWTSEFREDGALGPPRHVAGGANESILQPEWSPQGELHFVSDRTGWWNLYRFDGTQAVSLAAKSAEFGSPGWTFGQSHYAFLSDGRIACLSYEDGRSSLWTLDPVRGELVPLGSPWETLLPYLVAAPEGDRVWIVGASPTRPYTLLEVDTRTHQILEIRSSARFQIDERQVIGAEGLWFPTGEGEQVHAYFYPAHNPDFRAPKGEAPPLLVTCHGGPTGAAFADLKPTVQYWTSRGFSVLDVNHGGSTGFGRAYRQRLVGQWGIVDVRDCLAGAGDMARQGRVDSGRMGMRGGSAGGYTTLCALTFGDVFHAGAAYYAVADLEALARETHKFEARYLDRLVGPYPEMAQVYRDRSPLHSAGRLSRPVIFFHGLDDRVVPPAQAEAMVAALRARRVPHAYLPFAGESHGFRKAEVRARCLEAELYFYSKVFRFNPAEAVGEVEIEFLESL